MSLGAKCTLLLDGAMQMRSKTEKLALMPRIFQWALERWDEMKICASDTGKQRKPLPAPFPQPPAGCVYINLWRRSHHLVAPCGGIILPFLSRCTYNMLDGAIWYGSQYLIQFWFALSHIMNRWFWFALVLGRWKALWKSPTHWILP